MSLSINLDIHHSKVFSSGIPYSQVSVSQDTTQSWTQGSAVMLIRIRLYLYSKVSVSQDTTQSQTQGSTLVVAKRATKLLFLNSRFRNNTLVNINPNTTLSVFHKIQLNLELKVPHSLSLNRETNYASWTQGSAIYCQYQSRYFSICIL